MRKIILFFGLLVILSSFVSAIPSTDRTDYYYNNSKYYMADGIGGDIAINGSTPSDTNSIYDFGWTRSSTGGSATYSTSSVYMDDLSINLDCNSGGEYARLEIDNSTFKGKVGFSVMAPVKTSYGWAPYIRLTDASFIGALNFDASGWWVFYDGTSTQQCGGIDNGAAGKWVNLTFDFTSGTDIVYYVNDTLCYNATGRGSAGVDYIELIVRDDYSLWFDGFWMSNGDRPEEGEDNTPPALLNVNCTSCTEDSTPDQEPFETEDTTPTFKLDTNEPASCRIHRSDVDYDTMGASRNCTGGGTEGPHTCTLNVPDRFNTVGQNNIYISCIDSSSNENKTGYLMEIKGASEEHGDDAIEFGIDTSKIKDIAIKYQEQRLSARNLDNDQFTGIFDWVVANQNNSRKWAFNYVSEGETEITPLFNLSTVLYVLQIKNQTNESIIDEVGKLINSTWP